MKLYSYLIIILSLVSCNTSSKQQDNNVVTKSEVKDIKIDIATSEKMLFYDIINCFDKNYYPSDIDLEKYKNLSIILTDSILVFDNKNYLYFLTKESEGKGLFSETDNYRCFISYIDKYFNDKGKSSIKYLSVVNDDKTSDSDFLKSHKIIEFAGFLFLINNDKIICYKSDNRDDFIYEKINNSNETLPFSSKSLDEISFNERVAIWEQLFDKFSIDYTFANRFLSLSEFTCGGNNMNYLSFPQKKDTKIILTPANCGDFFHVYLLTFNRKGFVNSIYVDGVYSDPEKINNDDVIIEDTYFYIDENYGLTIYLKKGENLLKYFYQIEDDGNIVKILK